MLHYDLYCGEEQSSWNGRNMLKNSGPTSLCNCRYSVAIMMDTEGSEIHTQELEQPIKADVSPVIQVPLSCKPTITPLHRRIINQAGQNTNYILLQPSDLFKLQPADIAHNTASALSITAEVIQQRTEACNHICRKVRRSCSP